MPVGSGALGVLSEQLTVALNSEKLATSYNSPEYSISIMKIIDGSENPRKGQSLDIIISPF